MCKERHTKTFIDLFEHGVTKQELPLWLKLYASCLLSTFTLLLTGYDCAQRVWISHHWHLHHRPHKCWLGGWLFYKHGFEVTLFPASCAPTHSHTLNEFPWNLVLHAHSQRYIIDNFCHCSWRGTRRLLCKYIIRLNPMQWKIGILDQKTLYTKNENKGIGDEDWAGLEGNWKRIGGRIFRGTGIKLEMGTGAGLGVNRIGGETEFTKILLLQASQKLPLPVFASSPGKEYCFAFWNVIF